MKLLQFQITTIKSYGAYIYCTNKRVVIVTEGNLALLDHQNILHGGLLWNDLYYNIEPSTKRVYFFSLK